MNFLRDLPFLGVGIGFRPELQRMQSRHLERIDWFELIADRYLRSVPESIERATGLLGRQPLVPHGLELSVGTDEPLDLGYCDEVAELVRTVGAPFYSDHLCMTKAGGFEIGQLTPLAFTEATALRAAHKARQVQERLGVPLLLENVSYSFALPGSLSEADFITRVVTGADCGILLDLANVFINSQNHRYDPYAFLEALPLERVIQIHLAGGEKHGGRWVDSHSQPVDAHPEVWKLLEYVVARSPVRAVLIERDQNFPEDFGEMLADLERARDILSRRAPVSAPGPKPAPSEQQTPSPQAEAWDGAAFQVALARILVDPALRQRFVTAPDGTCAELGLPAEAAEALRYAGTERLETFAHEVASKRLMLIAKLAPATVKLLQREGLFHAVALRFPHECVPREAPEYPNRSVRDGFWILDLVERMISEGTLVHLLLADVVRFERAQLRLYSTLPPVESARAFHAARHSRPIVSDADLRALRPSLGAHAEVEHFSCDVTGAIRRITANEPLDGVAATPTQVLLLKSPGWRNVQPMGLNARTAAVLALCDGFRTGAQLVDTLLEGSSPGERAQREAGCLQLLRELYRLGAIALLPSSAC